jgi:hypothetical protein
MSAAVALFLTAAVAVAVILVVGAILSAAERAGLVGPR